MKVLIIEDEPLAAERLAVLVKSVDTSLEIVGTLESIAQTTSFLNTNAHPDLLLLDIQLSDGPSFEIFNRTTYNNAVIFTTAYDEHALRSFQFNSIDYILKPVTREALAQAVNKMRHLANCLQRPTVNNTTQQHYKSRFSGKIGHRMHFIEAADVSFFHADNKVTFLTDTNGTRYVIEHTLEKLEQVLNPAHFFRLSRRYIVHFKAIQHIKPYFNHRLKLQVSGASPSEEIIISREKVGEFKKWAEGA